MAESRRLQAERSFLQKHQSSNLAGLEGLLTPVSWFLHAELTAIKNNMIGLILLFSAEQPSVDHVKAQLSVWRTTLCLCSGSCIRLCDEASLMLLSSEQRPTPSIYGNP